MTQLFKPGEFVVYRKRKHSRHPSSAAKAVFPAPHGDDYSYCIDKQWTVIAIEPGGKVVVRTRRGKQHLLSVEDPALRRATWWERLLQRRRFPALDHPA